LYQKAANVVFLKLLFLWSLPCIVGWRLIWCFSLSVQKCIFGLI
jgi:hypothetical protein